VQNKDFSAIWRDSMALSFKRTTLFLSSSLQSL